MIWTAGFLAYAALLSAGLARAGVRSSAVRPRRAPPGRPERILIVGATGGTGRQLVACALERGFTVTAFVRDASRLALRHERLRVVTGDVLDSSSVREAVRGQEAVVCALGHKRLFLQPTTILSRGTANLLAAMEESAVSRLVCETALGIGDSAGRMGIVYTLFVIPVVLPFYFWDKTRQERAIAKSRADWVIVRPAALTNGEKRGVKRQGQRAGSFLATRRISRADVAEFMLDQLTDDSRLGTAVGISW